MQWGEGGGRNKIGEGEGEGDSEGGGNTDEGNIFQFDYHLFH